MKVKKMSDFKVGDKVRVKGKKYRKLFGVKKSDVGEILCMPWDMAKVKWLCENERHSYIKYSHLELVSDISSATGIDKTCLHDEIIQLKPVVPSKQTVIPPADITDSFVYETGGIVNLSGFKNEACNGKFTITSGSMIGGFTAKKIDVQKSKCDAMGVVYPIKPVIKPCFQMDNPNSQTPKTPPGDQVPVQQTVQETEPAQTDSSIYDIQKKTLELLMSMDGRLSAVETQIGKVKELEVAEAETNLFDMMSKVLAMAKGIDSLLGAVESKAANARSIR